MNFKQIAALTLGIAGLVAAAFGGFMIHTGLGVLILGAYAIISARQVLQAEAVAQIQEAMKEQFGDLKQMFG